MLKFYSEVEPNYHDDGQVARHHCDIPSIYFNHGEAIEDCNEDADGRLFVSNDEYGSQVNFCPMCGFKAFTQIVDGQ